MKPFIYSILFLTLINTVFSQTEELVLRKSFETDENTILNIEIDNATIQFKESNDNKIHLDYSIVFKNKTKEQTYRVFKGINAKASKDKNIVNLEVVNSMYLGELHNLDVDINTYKQLIRGYFKKKKGNKFLYKSKDSILKEIDFSLGPDMDDFFKKLKQNNPNKDFGEASRKFDQKFIIRVPKNIKIKIKALHSRITFHYNIDKPIEISSFQTYFKFEKINAIDNKFNLMSGILQAKEIKGGNYKLKDINKVVIGSISNSKLETETSRILIGEIRENVEIIDAYSKLYLYNFDKNFTKFKLKGEYSKLSLYDRKETNYSVNVYGYNTALNMKEFKTTVVVSKGQQKITKILDKKVEEGKISDGTLEIELINGILNIK